MPSDITLTAGMRSNLLSLQQTTGLQGKTQERLASGKKVNSALDNPTNFFAAQSHNNRASDMTNRKDGMSEAVQMVKAADGGITGITSLVEAAKGVAAAALATTSSTDRTTFATTFDSLLSQITQLASDSGYRGTNFLNGQAQTVEFGQTTGAATLQINGFNATSSGLGISSTIGVGGTTTITNNNPPPDATYADTADVTTTGIAQYIGGTFVYSGALATDIASNPGNYRLVDNVTGAKAYINGLNGDNTLHGTKMLPLEFTFGNPTTLEYYAGGVDMMSSNPNPVTTTITTPANTWSSTAGIQSSATQLESALTTLRSQSSNLSANLSVVTTRQNFTDEMINTLQTGADNLTLANMNKEGANMLMLQTRQQLGTTSLSMASQASQAVLRLF